MKEPNKVAKASGRRPNPASPEYRLFQLSAFCLVFILGGVLAANDMQPFRWIFSAYEDLIVLKNEASMTSHSLVIQKVYGGEGVTLHDRSRSYAGITAIQGIFDEGVQVRLVDMQGNIIHKWTVDYFDIWPTAPSYLLESNVPKTHADYHSQGFSLLPDGSIVLSLGNLGTAKLDKCSNTVWTVDRATHHVVTPADRGGFWIAGNRKLDEIDSSLMQLGVSASLLESSLGRYENLLIRVNSEGQVEQEISVLGSLLNGNYVNQIFDSLLIDRTDPTHINDIEVVTTALADKIDGVDSGDLLVSIRQMHSLAIFDVEDGEILWMYRGPWVRQHDPDILPNGNIRVFDNASMQLGFSPFGGSSLIELDPATEELSLVYPTNQSQRFFTDIMGIHQQLPNGNQLIAESRRGRVFEISPEGETVWEFIENYDETHAALIEAAERLDASFFDVHSWICN